MANQKFLMSEEAMKIAKENSKKQMPSETQKQFIESRLIQLMMKSM
jgi:hypothetical protein